MPCSKGSGGGALLSMLSALPLSAVSLCCTFHVLETYINLLISSDEYINMVNDASIKTYIKAKVKETGQVYCDIQVVEFSKPELEAMVSMNTKYQELREISRNVTKYAKCHEIPRITTK